MTCTTVYSPVGAGAFVAGGYNTFIPLAVGTYNVALNQAGQLAQFTVAPVQYAANFNFSGQLSQFHRPEAPDLDYSELEFSPSVLNDVHNLRAPPEFTEAPLTLAPAPPFTAEEPVLRFPGRPNPLAVPAPGAAPGLPSREAPEEPPYALPEIPDLEQVLVPLPRTFTFPEWDVDRPDVELPEPNLDWNFTPDEYTSTALDAVKARLMEMLEGGTGLPAHIEQALYERAIAREDRDAIRVLQEIDDEFATYGFSEPPGALHERKLRVRQGNQDKRNDLSRKILTDAIQIEIENIRFAVTSAITLEQTLINLFERTQTLLLEASKFMLEVSIRAFESRIALVKLEYDIFATEAQVFEQQIRAKVAEVEAYRAELEAARVRGELNEQLVRRYVAEIEAIKAMSDFYNSRVQAFRGLIESDVAKIEGFRAQTQAYAETVRAKVAEFDAYRAGIEAEGAKAGVYDTSVRAFTARVGAVNESNRILLEKERTRVAQHQADLEAWGKELDLLQTRLAAEQERVRSVALAFDTEGRVFSSEATVETAAAAAKDRTFQLGLERERARVGIALEDARIRVTENTQNRSIELRAQETYAQVASQVAAGMSSAVHFSASTGEALSLSQSCATNYSYSE